KQHVRLGEVAARAGGDDLQRRAGHLHPRRIRSAPRGRHVHHARRRKALYAAIGVAGEAVLTTIREMLENIERDTLVPRAARSAETRGRDREEAEDDIRPSYQRDRDRIIHCKAFRRLKHKTQVFLAPEGDHYRTRLTHVLEVTQIARTIAKSLRLNEVLTEAMGLGHDLGHSAFGHAGEAALNKLVKGGFDHYRQSVRVVETLEKDG